MVSTVETSSNRKSKKHKPLPKKSTKPSSTPSKLETIRCSHMILASPQKIFSFCRDFSQFQILSPHIKSLEKTSDDNVWIWHMELAKGLKDFVWGTQLIKETPNKLLEWKTIDAPGAATSQLGSVFKHRGILELKPLPNDRGTLVTLKISFDSPLESLIKKAGTLLMMGPEAFAKKILHRLASVIETGVLPTTEGQPRGGVDKELSLQ
jgi:uncharacterized membrane protein